MSGSSWPRSTLPPPPSWTTCPLLRTGLFPIKCITQPPSVWFSIFLREMNVIFWSTQVSLVFLSEGIKARGEESAAESGFLLMPGEKDKSGQGRRGGRESKKERGNSLPHLIKSEQGLFEVEKQLPCSRPSPALSGAIKCFGILSFHKLLLNLMFKGPWKTMQLRSPH